MASNSIQDDPMEPEERLLDYCEDYLGHMSLKLVSGCAGPMELGCLAYLFENNVSLLVLRNKTAFSE